LGVFYQCMRQVNLRSLIQNLPDSSGVDIPDATVTGIVLDSRQVKPGDVFVALVGENSDGHQYIDNAVDRGAVAVVGTQTITNLDVPYFKVKDGRYALAQISAAFYDFPTRKLTVIGVTGTDGKTTTSNLIYHILQRAGIRAGMISTVNAQIGEKILDTGFHVTTPEAPDVQRYLAEMVAAGITHVVLEATSHGLDQQRVAACDIDLSVVTNITHEHLDYHGSYEAYQAAKGRLFTELAVTQQKEHGNPRLAVLNVDDVSFDYLLDLVKYLSPEIRVVTYGLGTSADVRGFEILSHSVGLQFSAIVNGSQMQFVSNLVGNYNVSNCLASIAATVVGLGVESHFAQEAIATMEGIPGRMEVIAKGQGFLAIVDFAHTPNALQNALKTAKQLTSGRVIAVFGSAGLRDRQKRRIMAEISAEMADLTVLTAEDPRTESLGGILSEMADGAVSQGGVENQTFWRVPDRGNAIRFAIGLAKPGDVVISCGKGHEQSMCFGEVEYPWDDRTAMDAALSEFLGIKGPQMPYLPTQSE
jgi:UDP-N-acetylmuramoyl-L-alanyl-D-glutamate--2,6-diaminopimelate ligase